MNINIKSLLLGTSLSLIPQYAAAQCVETDCLKLGYTKLEKCDNGLKCPFGEYWACPKVEEKAVLGQCTGYAKNCKIGDILNSDGTCSADKVNGKIPIGVVVYISQDGYCGQAMTAEPITRAVWKPEGVQAPLFDKNESEALQDYDSCGNTNIITNSGTAEMFPAAWAAKNYAPATAPETKGKWCLPAAGILSSVYYQRSIINKSFPKVGGVAIVNAKEKILSSTRFSFAAIWYYCSNDEFACAYDNGLNPMVMRVADAIRPVIEF